MSNDESSHEGSWIMSAPHEHDTGSKLGIGLLLNSVYTIIEFVFGILTGSLALIADAAHNLTDSLTLTISYIANRLAKRNPTESKSFGYGRVTILAALLNSVVMVGVALFIALEAVKRIQEPVEVQGGVIAAVALVGIVINGSIAYVLSKDKHDINVRSAFINMAFDTLSSVGAVIAGLVIMFTGVQYVDALIGLLISAMLLYSTYRIFKETLHILLEGTPSEIDGAAVRAAICEHDQVLAVDDLHVWSIRSGYNALSCHIVIEQSSMQNSQAIIVAVKADLYSRFAIHHATIEAESAERASDSSHINHAP